jgi:UDP:flavonoid glycosyltransferase YjiC (YdhE family)
MKARKKIILIGPPFSGHFHSLLGIGMGLHQTSDVIMISTPGAAAEASALGLASREILAEHEGAVWEIAEPGSNVKGNPILLYRQLNANVALLQGLKSELDLIFRTEKPDLVIADFTVPVAGICAKEQGIPWWTTMPSPCVIETPDGPPAYFGGLAPAGSWSESLMHSSLRLATKVFKRSMWMLFRSQFRAIGFPGIYRKDGSERVYSDERILGLTVSEIEFPGTYPSCFRYVGPVFHTPVETGPSPVFFPDGRPRVLVTLGTHLPHAKAGLSETVLDIAKRHPGIVFHFSHGRDHGARLPTGEENFQNLPYVSYARHLQEYDLIVHHGGSGVMNHCLYHGKPAVVYPHDYDQFDHAIRLVTAGLALRAREPKDLEPAILQALADKAMHERCRIMAESCRTYHAVESIRQWVDESP